MLDAALALPHHAGAFGLVSAQAMAVTMLRGPLDAPRLARLVAVDRLGRVALGLAASAGPAREARGPKGAAFYLANPSFWPELALVAVIAGLSAAPARRLRAWHGAARQDPGWRPDAAAGARRQRTGATHVVVGVPVAAVAMARGIGLG